MKVLLIEPCKESGDALVELFGANGYYTIWRRAGADAVALHAGADVVLLNLDLPDVNGLDLLRRMRGSSKVPVLAMVCQDDGSSAKQVLYAGADDCVVKPIWAAGLLARIEAAIARRGQTPSRRVISVDDTYVHIDARAVIVGGEPVALTTKEFDVLALLARHAGRAVSRTQIMRAVWGAATLALSRNLDVHMFGLRAKLGRPQLLHTIRGYGYRLGPPVASAADMGATDNPGWTGELPPATDLPRPRPA